MRLNAFFKFACILLGTIFVVGNLAHGQTPEQRKTNRLTAFNEFAAKADLGPSARLAWDDQKGVLHTILRSSI
jgi:hypothetical protein